MNDLVFETKVQLFLYYQGNGFRDKDLRESAHSLLKIWLLVVRFFLNSFTTLCNTMGSPSPKNDVPQKCEKWKSVFGSVEIWKCPVTKEPLWNAILFSLPHDKDPRDSQGYGHHLAICFFYALINHWRTVLWSMSIFTPGSATPLALVINVIVPFLGTIIEDQCQKGMERFS